MEHGATPPVLFPHLLTMTNSGYYWNHNWSCTQPLHCYTCTMPTKWCSTLFSALTTHDVMAVSDRMVIVVMATRIVCGVQ